MSDYSVTVSLGGVGGTALSGVYNVLDYGAARDGVSDDSAAINAAVAAAKAAGGGTVLLPMGTYLISSQIAVTDADDVCIDGSGSTILAGASMSGAMFAVNSSANFTVKDVSLDGDNLAQWGFDFKGCSGLVIDNVEIYDIEEQAGSGNYAAGIRVGNYSTEGAVGCTITRSYIHDIGSTVNDTSRGVVFYTYQNTGDVFVKDIVISGCRFKEISPVGDGDGIVFQMAKSSGAALDDPVNATVSGCTFVDCYKRAVKIQNMGVTVNGNAIHTTRTGTWGGASWSGFQYSGVSIYESSCTVSNNTLLATGGGAFQYGIDTDGGTRNVNNISISGNVIKNSTTATGEASEPYEQAIGIRIARADANGTTADVTVSGNAVFATNYAYYAGYDVDNVNFTGNTESGSSSGLTLYTPSDTIANLIVVGNSFPDGTTMGGALLSSPQIVLGGSGSPEGAAAAPIGSLFMRDDGGRGTTLYVKEANATSAGWTGIGFSSSNTAAADDTTPSVLYTNVLLLGDNTGATAITQLDDAFAGQEVVLVVTGSSNTPTIADSGNFNLSAAWAPGTGDTLTLVSSDGSTWYEISRSDN